MKRTNMLLAGLFVAAAAVGSAALTARPTATGAEAYYGGGEEDTFRIWVNRNGHYMDEGTYWRVYANGNYYDPQHVQAMANGSNYVNGKDNTWLAYYDLPLSVAETGFDLRPYSSTWLGGQSIHVDYKDGMNSQVIYINYSGTVGSVSLGSASQSGARLVNSILDDVLEAYYTCSSDPNNGYGSFDDLYETWQMNTLADDTPIADYMKGEDGTYNYAGEKNGTTTLREKAETMRMLAESQDNAQGTASFASLFDGDDNSLLVVGVVSALALAALGGGVAYLAVRKRKETGTRA